MQTFHFIGWKKGWHFFRKPSLALAKWPLLSVVYYANPNASYTDKVHLRMNWPVGLPQCPAAVGGNVSAYRVRVSLPCHFLFRHFRLSTRHPLRQTRDDCHHLIQQKHWVTNVYRTCCKLAIERWTSQGPDRDGLVLQISYKRYMLWFDDATCLWPWDLLRNFIGVGLRHPLGPSIRPCSSSLSSSVNWLRTKSMIDKTVNWGSRKVFTSVRNTEHFVSWTTCWDKAEKPSVGSGNICGAGRVRKVARFRCWILFHVQAHIYTGTLVNKTTMMIFTQHNRTLF